MVRSEFSHSQFEGSGWEDDGKKSGGGEVSASEISGPSGYGGRRSVEGQKGGERGNGIQGISGMGSRSIGGIVSRESREWEWRPAYMPKGRGSIGGVGVPILDPVPGNVFQGLGKGKSWKG